MFDIGVSELFVIGVVALVVIGPEKLPRVARTIGHLTGRLQRYVNDVKADINREIELEELRRFKQEVEETAHSFESSVRAEMGKTESELNQAAQQLADLGANPGAAPAPTDALTQPAHPSELPDTRQVAAPSPQADSGKPGEDATSPRAAHDAGSG